VCKKLPTMISNLKREKKKNRTRPPNYYFSILQRQKMEGVSFVGGQDASQRERDTTAPTIHKEREACYETRANARK